MKTDYYDLPEQLKQDRHLFSIMTWMFVGLIIGFIIATFASSGHWIIIIIGSGLAGLIAGLLIHIVERV